MKLGYLIYSEYESKRNREFISKLLSSSEKLKVKLILLLSEKLNFSIVNNQKKIHYEGKIIDTPDFVIQRTMNYELSRRFESLGIRVFNSSDVSFIADNKFNAYEEISKLGIPVLKTVLQKKNIMNNIFYPNVTKPVGSKGGDRVFYNNNENEYNISIKDINDEDFILQEPSEELGKDLRVYVIGKEIITSILRTSKSGFLSNYCKGGSASIYNLNNDEKKIVYKIINHFDFDYVGVDFLFNKNYLVFNEIENVVGARMVYELTDINIGHLFMEHIIKILG